MNEPMCPASCLTDRETVPEGSTRAVLFAHTAYKDMHGCDRFWAGCFLFDGYLTGCRRFAWEV